MIDEISVEKLAGDIHAALKNWQTIQESNENLLDYLLLVHDQRKLMGISNPASLRLATNRVLRDGIKAVKERDAQAATIIEKRFLEKEQIRGLSHQFKVNEDRFKRMQRAAILLLASALHDQELKLQEERITSLESRLETKSYTRLFGIASLAEKLFHHLSDPQAHEIVMLSGLGGIGKTSLANYVVRQIIRRFYFESVVWIAVTDQNEAAAHDPVQRFEQLMHQLCAKLLPHLPSSTRPQQRQEQLRQLLKRTPYLVVVDNLELPSDMSYLLSNVLELSAPGKFLLTSRTQPMGHAGVKCYVLNELPLTSSLDLIRHYAGEVGLDDLVEAEDNALAPIYEGVGGNPYALKLVVGLALTRPLPDILHDLQTGYVAGETLYNKIFWQAWHSLSEPAKALLTIMPLAPDNGVLPEQILSISDLSKETLWPAINELASRSLIEVKGTVWERRYGVHQLTKTFIQSQIIQDE
ncbi:MAG: AAA family ATPase [Chloroflexi bacterium]|nr:AAA family ATPase [Chloroflexota bacterium]